MRGIRNLKEKQRICREAALKVSDQDILFVDNSSTCLSLLQYLPEDLHVTIITNSIKFLTESGKYHRDNVDFYCMGGMYNRKNLSTYDTFPAPAGTGFYPDKCFISCNGISNERLITDGSILEVRTKKQMMDISAEVYLLADHTKFGMEGQYFLGDGSDIGHIITDAPVETGGFPFLDHAEIIVAE